jgi:oligopeptide/dipeptide ABC transporter ATP-binding protein
MQELLKVNELVTSFRVGGSWVPALQGVSFSIFAGHTVGLVGESGSGKSVTAMSILRLLPNESSQITNGEVWFQSENLARSTEARMRSIRGNQIGMVFQEPMTSLNPVFTIGEQISEVFRIHRDMSRRDARGAAIEMLRKVKIPSPEQRVDEFPHQLSGGMRQRVMIAMALACRPQLLIADEPTTALDVTIQAQIMKLIRDLQAEFSMAVMLITHDLGIVSEFCQEICVMYGGRIVERGPVKEVFSNPSHPYTRGLLQSIPKIGVKVDRLSTIPGQVPGIGKFPPGCPFQNRCPHAMDACRNQVPGHRSVTSRHSAACFLVDAPLAEGGHA